MKIGGIEAGEVPDLPIRRFVLGLSAGSLNGIDNWFYFANSKSFDTHKEAWDFIARPGWNKFHPHAGIHELEDEERAFYEQFWSTELPNRI